jgi:hypothetical protein
MLHGSESLAGTLVLWLVYAVFLKVSVAIVGGSREGDNGIVRAFFTAAILAATTAVAERSGAPGIGLVAAIAGWAAVRYIYDIGWIRAALVFVTLWLLRALVVMFVLVPLGLAAAAGLLVVLTGGLLSP